MAPYSPPTAGRAGKLRLDFNENTVGCSPQSDRVPAASTSPPTHLTIYPEYQDARRDLAAFFGVAPDEFAHHQRHRRSDPGPDQHLCRRWRRRAAAQAFLRDVPVLRRGGRSVRSRSRIRRRSQLSGRRTFSTQLRPETRAILIANPNNPTGTAIGLDQIERILETAPDAAVLIDEAYFEFCGVTALRWINEYQESVRQPDVFESLWDGRDALRLPVLAARKISRGFTRRNRLTA